MRAKDARGRRQEAWGMGDGGHKVEAGAKWSAGCIYRVYEVEVAGVRGVVRGGKGASRAISIS